MSTPPRALDLAVSAFQAGRLAEAQQLCDGLIARDGADCDALHLLAVVQAQRGDMAGSLVSFERVLALRPGDADAAYNRSRMLESLGRFDEALAGYDRILTARPMDSDALCNRGVVLQALGRFEEALASYDRALAIRPDFADALYNRGNVLQALERYERAVASYDRALAAQPRFAEALSNRGNALQQLKRYGEALSSYDGALALRPDYPDALYNRGNVLQTVEQYEGAVASYDRALALRPDFAEALGNRGAALRQLRRYGEALASYEAALATPAGHAHAFSGAADCAIKLSDWASRGRFAAQMRDRVFDDTSIISPFGLLGYSDDPALQLRCAEKFTRDAVPASARRPWSGQVPRHDKLRIAYLSADFRSHPVAYLTVELFECHDRQRFDTIAVSFGPDDRSPMRARLMAGFDAFHDVRAMSDQQVADFLRELEIDIAIDLMGHTQNARTGILARRPAPIQVSYMGLPATMGADFIDYIIGDEVVTPFEHQPFFSEKIAQLPVSYLVSDRRRLVAEHTPTRREMDLPEDGFVFCCFNNSWKITPDLFDVWMRLLNQVPGSVLWLLRDNDQGDENLRREARARGIDAQRLVFAGRIPADQHMARHRLADLLLDTLPYNAHTTASDALWMGLPMVTCMGGAFASRVAASVLRGCDLDELITDNLADYEALALKLASEPALLADVRTRLGVQRAALPAFDTDRFARHMEAAYETMWDLWRRGEAPQSFAVEAIR